MKTCNMWTQLVTALMLAVLFLTGCAGAGPVGPGILDGQVIPLQPGSTVQGIESALNGATGTVVLRNGDKIFMGWPQNYAGQPAYGFACTNCGVLLQRDPKALMESMGGKGNIANVKTFSDLCDYMKGNGWSVGAPLLGKGQTFIQWFRQIAVNTITIIVVPVSVFPTAGPQS